MKGPYERLKYELRRLWECPVCHHRERTVGQTTSIYCGDCEKKDATKLVSMTLIGDGARLKD
jgi:transcription elongation factor Elf1